MNNQEPLLFKYLYYVYMAASILTVIISIFLVVKLYVFSLKVTTVADVFFVLIMMLSSFYFRFNAFHYQKLFINRGV